MDQPRGHDRRRGPASADSCSAAAWSASSWRRRGRRSARRSRWSRRLTGCSPARSRSPASRCAESLRDGRRRPRRRPRPRGRRDATAGEFARRRSTTASTLRSDELLVAVGRKPADRRPRPGDDRPRARASTIDGRRPRCACPGRDWLYAIGDVNGRALLTHMGKYQAADRGRHDPRTRGSRAIMRTGRALAARDLHRAAGRRRRADARARARGRDRGAGRRQRSRRDRRRELHRRRRAGTARGSSSTRIARGADRARRSRARRSPSPCTRRRSRSSARFRSTRLVHAVPSFPTRSEVWLRLLADWAP